MTPVVLPTPVAPVFNPPPEENQMAKAKRSDEAWKARFEPYAQAYSKLLSDIDVVVGESDDDELATLAEQAAAAAMGNCWWATYQVAQLIAHEVAAEQFRRERLRGLGPVAAVSAPPEKNQK